MIDNTTSAAPSKSKASDTLNLEMISSELDMSLTFIAAAEQFAHSLHQLATMSSAAICGTFQPDIEHAQNMISEIGNRLRGAKEQLDAFIDAVPVHQLSAERKAS